MTFSIGTTPALASLPATASKTSRKLPSGTRLTSPNAVIAASSANAPGSPAYAIGSLVVIVARVYRREAPPSPPPYRSNQAVVSRGTFSSSRSARCSRAAPAETATPRRLPAASVAPSQGASASSVLSAAMYASIEAAMMFAPRASPVYSPLPRSPPMSGGAIRTVTAPIVSVPSPSAWMSYASSRGWPVRTPESALSTARYRASIAPLPVSDARHSWSPEAMTTAPRLRTLLPDDAVQRARWRAAPSVPGIAFESVIGSPPWGRGRAVGRSPTRRGRCVAARGGREVAFVPAPQLGAGLPDPVFERVGERRGGRRDDVGVAAHRRPGPRPVHRIDDDPGPGGSRRAAVEDTHLVVDEVDLLDAGIERAERLPQRGVQGVDRSVPVGGRMQDLAGDLDLDGRLGQHLAPVPLLDQACVIDDPERRDIVRGVAPDEQ